MIFYIILVCIKVLQGEQLASHHHHHHQHHHRVQKKESISILYRKRGLLSTVYPRLYRYNTPAVCTAILRAFACSHTFYLIQAMQILLYLCMFAMYIHQELNSLVYRLAAWVLGIL